MKHGQFERRISVVIAGLPMSLNLIACLSRGGGDASHALTPDAACGPSPSLMAWNMTRRTVRPATRFPACGEEWSPARSRDLSTISRVSGNA